MERWNGAHARTVELGLKREGERKREREREVEAISDEQFSGNICDVLHIWIKYLHFIDTIVIN